MKKSSFLLPLVGLIAVSCANNDPNNNGSYGNHSEDAIKGYLAVKIVAPGNVSTRAEYQYGTAEESYVNLVRFYFFDEDGNAVMVRKNPNTEDEYYSYYDWNPTDQDNANGATGTPGTSVSDYDNSQEGSVEKVLSTTITLRGPEDEPKPSAIVAIVNPSSKVLTISNPDLSDLRDEDMVADYLTELTDKNFVMSNSVFSNNGTAIYAQPIDEKCLATSLASAQENPLDVFVERVVARLDLSIGISEDKQLKVGNDILYDINFELTTQDPTYEGQTAPEDSYTKEKVYAKFYGWAVTSTPKVSNLIKEINTSWKTNLFGLSNEPWNSADYHRSFWAYNPESLTDNAEEGYVWFSYNELSGQNSTTQTGFPMTKKTTYMQENANPYNEGEDVGENPQEPSKVIFAAQLVNNEGTPITLAEYNHEYYTLQGLKNLAANNLDLYYKEGDSFKKISPQMITFMTHKEFKNNSTAIGEYGGYLVYFSIDPTTTTNINQWYHKNSASTGNADTDYTVLTKAPQMYMYEALGSAMVWNKGYTYYFFDINHLGAPENTGHVGVVRNHIYSAIVNGLSKLGTPVWNPAEEIYPQKPDRTGDLIVAQVKVLMWRMLEQYYDLAW